MSEATLLLLRANLKQLKRTRPANDVPPRSDLVGGSHGLGNRENP